MIKRHTNRLHKSLTLCLFLCFIPLCVIAQDNSLEYITIKGSKTLSLSKKIEQINSMFLSKRQDTLTTILIQDYLDFGRDFYRQDLEKTIEITQGFVDFFIDKNIPLEEIHKNIINNLGYFYKKNNEYANSIKIYKLLIRNNNSDEFAMDAYISIANNYEFLGDLFTASQYYERSIASRKKIDDENSHIAYLKNSIDASINYKKIGTTKSINRGIIILNDAISFAKEKRINSKLVSLYLNLGNLYNDRVDFDFENSVINYKKALRIALKTNDSKYLPRIYNDLGYSHFQNNDSLAIYYFNKALDYNNLDPSFKSIVYKNKSTYYLDKNIDKALENSEYAIQALLVNSIVDTNKTLLNKEVLALNPYKYDLLNNIIHKGKVLLAVYSKDSTNQNTVKEALKIFHLADYLVDNIRFESIETSSKLFWRSMASEIYTNATKACHILNNPDDAFYFIEKNKAILLLEDVTQKQLKENIPQDVIQRERLHKQKINNLKGALSTIKNKDSIRTLLLDAKNNYSIFIDSLETHYSNYYKSIKPAKVLSLKESQETLINKKAVYLSYILNDIDGFGLLISESETSFFKIKNVDELASLSTRFRELLESPIQNKVDLDDYTNLANTIYTSLFPESITAKIKGKRITVIPDNYLQNIPFEALLTSNKPGAYLILEQEINYAYSITFLNQNSKRVRQNETQFLGFAPIHFNNGLSSLPKSQQEIEAISNLFSSKTFKNQNASSQNFINHAKNHSIIHLATHANANDSINPWISFNDKSLTLNELYLTENTADLVVLSACKTSVGELSHGEGVMSLARGFFNTGSNSVLSTLWNANDKSTSEIMIHFYKKLSEGHSKSEALHLAKLSYIKSNQLSEQSPHYWASFVLIGNTDNIVHSNTKLYISLLIGFLLLLIIFFVYKLKK